MPISFSCTGCGQAYKVPDGSAGRATKCRKCGTVVNIPKESSIASKPAAPPPPADAFNFAVDDSPARGSTAPTTTGLKKKKKGKKGMILALFGILFAFFGCCLLPGTAGVAYFFLFMGDDDGMKYMPDNPRVVVSIRPQDILQSDVFAQVKKEVPDSDKDMATFDNQLNDMTGLSKEDIDRMLVGFTSPDEASMVTMTKKPVDIQKVLDAAKKNNKKFKEVKVGKYTTYEEDPGEGGQISPSAMALCAPEPKILLAAQPKLLRTILERGKKATTTESMTATLKRTDMKKSIAVAVDVKAIKSSFPRESDVLKRVKGADKVEGAVLTVSVKTDIVIDAILLCQDETSAEDLRKAIEGLVTVAGMGLEGMGGPSEARDALNAIKFTNSGKEVLANAVLKGSDVAKGIGKSVGTKVQPVPGRIGPPPPDRK